MFELIPDIEGGGLSHGIEMKWGCFCGNRVQLILVVQRVSSLCSLGSLAVFLNGVFGNCFRTHRFFLWKKRRGEKPSIQWENTSIKALYHNSSFQSLLALHYFRLGRFLKFSFGIIPNLTATQRQISHVYVT